MSGLQGEIKRFQGVTMARGNNVHNFFQRGQAIFQLFQAEAPIYHWTTIKHHKPVVAIESSNAKFSLVNGCHGLSCRGTPLLLQGQWQASMLLAISAAYRAEGQASASSQWQ
jgi:hypothetical protein